MILLVDVGNTRVKWRYLSEDYVVLGCGELQVKLISLVSLNNLLQKYAVKQVYLSNVGQESVLSVFKEFTEKNKISLYAVKSNKKMCSI